MTQLVGRKRGAVVVVVVGWWWWWWWYVCVCVCVWILMKSRSAVVTPSHKSPSLSLSLSLCVCVCPCASQDFNVLPLSVQPGEPGACEDSVWAALGGSLARQKPSSRPEAGRREIARRT